MAILDDLIAQKLQSNPQYDSDIVAPTKEPATIEQQDQYNQQVAAQQAQPVDIGNTGLSSFNTNTAYTDQALPAVADRYDLYVATPEQAAAYRKAFNIDPSIKTHMEYQKAVNSTMGNNAIKDLTDANNQEFAAAKADRKENVRKLIRAYYNITEGSSNKANNAFVENTLKFLEDTNQLYGSLSNIQKALYSSKDDFFSRNVGEVVSSMEDQMKNSLATNPLTSEFEIDDKGQWKYKGAKTTKEAYAIINTTMKMRTGKSDEDVQSHAANIYNQIDTRLKSLGVQGVMPGMIAELAGKAFDEKGKFNIDLIDSYVNALRAGNSNDTPINMRYPSKILALGKDAQAKFTVLKQAQNTIKELQEAEQQIQKSEINLRSVVGIDDAQAARYKIIQNNFRRRALELRAKLLHEVYSPVSTLGGNSLMHSFMAQNIPEKMNPATRFTMKPQQFYKTSFDAIMMDK